MRSYKTYILIKMAEAKCLICACCFIAFGKESHKLIKVTPALQLHIQNLFWRKYDVEKECCLIKIYVLPVFLQ